MKIVLSGCTSTPFGSYLKALGVFRLISQQADGTARGWWTQRVFCLESTLDENEIVEFFLDRYRPTPILAPWNGGSGFYPKDNKEGIDAIAGSKEERFEEYRESIAFCREMPEIQAGKGKDEDERRLAILLACRNFLSDSSVEWIDAAVGVAADGSRAFAPVVGTGGNEGRLDYTNNFMARIAALLIQPANAKNVGDLLRNAVFARRTTLLEKGAAGQYDPGRAGGANQGAGVESESVVNPWDLVLTLEGAVMWASGLYRRQGVSYRSVLCSPFTVKASRVGYGSAAENDDSRAEIWAPMWPRPVAYRELRTLLREGRASIDGRAAKTGIEFAEAARSLGVDRGIREFVRYSLLKRRGDSYVALPAGHFPAAYKREADYIRQFQSYFDKLCRGDLPTGAQALRREVEAAIFDVLQHGGQERMRALMRAFGRMVRRILTTSEKVLPRNELRAADWLEACGLESVETTIAGAMAGSFKPSMMEFLYRKNKGFAWSGRDLPDRMIAVLDRKLLSVEEPDNIHQSHFRVHPIYASVFVQGATDDDAIEELLFAFVTFTWAGQRLKAPSPVGFLLPVYDLLRREVSRRVLNLLRSGRLTEAGNYVVDQLRHRQQSAMRVDFGGEVEVRRLAAALLIPVWKWKEKANTDKDNGTA